MSQRVKSLPSEDGPPEAYDGLDRPALDRRTPPRRVDAGLGARSRRPQRDTTDDALLALLHRLRPATVAEAESESSLPPAKLRQALQRLEARGLVVVRDEGLRYPHPAVGTADLVSARIAALRAGTAEALDEIENLVADLPSILRQWSVGVVEQDQFQVVTLHGPLAAENLWFEIADHHGGSLQAVVPNVERFLTAEDSRVALFAKAVAGKDVVRALIPASAVSTPHGQEQILRYVREGMEFRTLDSPPSWFWVDGDQVAVPYTWGEGRPASVMAIRHAALAELTRAYYAELWRRSGPVVPTAVDSWVPLLRLMRQGITLETASRMVGVNPRTGRRRVAAAMTHYGVSTLFALGVACSADLDRLD